MALVGELRSIILPVNTLLVIIQMRVAMLKMFGSGQKKMTGIVLQLRIVLQKPGERGKICIVRPKAWALFLVLFVACIIMPLDSVLVESGKGKQKGVRSSDPNPGNCVVSYNLTVDYSVRIYHL